MIYYYRNLARGKKAIIRVYENRCVVTVGMFDTKEYKTLRAAKNFLERERFEEIDGDTYRTMR